MKKGSVYLFLGFLGIFSGLLLWLVNPLAVLLVMGGGFLWTVGISTLWQDGYREGYGTAKEWVNCCSKCGTRYQESLTVDITGLPACGRCWLGSM